jgi:hypothetical protein
VNLAILLRGYSNVFFSEHPSSPAGSLHPRKLRQEKRVNLLEATEKHMKTNAFEPLVGKFVDPLVEERVKSIDDAREVEINMRGDAKFPPSYKGRETAAYGIVSHETYDRDMLRLYDTLEKERTGRFKNRYIVDHNFHAQDIKGDHINELRQLNRVAPERYEEQRRRGYDTSMAAGDVFHHFPIG